MRKAALCVVALLAIPAAMQAQKCTGQAPWSSGSIKVGGALEFGDGYTQVNGAVGLGKDGGLFFGGGAGLVFPSGGDSYLEVQGGIGKEMSSSGKIALCPIVNVHAGFPEGHSYQTLLGGVALGYPVSTSSSSMGLIITGSGQVGFTRASGGGHSETDFGGVIGGGVGLIFNDRISLTPGVFIGFGGGESDVFFRAAASIAVGKKGGS